MAQALNTGQQGTQPSVMRAMRPVGRFARHLFEMCMAMCIGVAVLDLPFFGVVSLLGYSDPLRQLPELSALVVAFNMSVPMAAWMRHRGHEWSCIWEMSGAMVAEAILLIGVAWLGVFPKANLVAWQHTLMVPAMVVVMLYRLDVYTGGVRHQAQPA